ncbi:MAG: N-acetyltransferase [Clostridia bacterium]|nr:N-acetyltransferase [Clostridia bacterium]
MSRTILTMRERYLLSSLDLVERVFGEWDSPEEGKTVRRLVEEIRAKKYYLPELELLMVDEQDEIIGYAMFSRFHIEGRYENELLILTPVAVRPDRQRQGISRELIEYGFDRARKMGYKAVLVEGDPKNYNPRGFETSADHDIIAGPNIHLPHVSCLMVKELVPGALKDIHGVVDYSFYETLREA